jgi:nitroimidazol reductase NimA-like FMN-containing flavoprotein (pyridoxamine 5'-phosphate oxidase superfamily)
MRRSEKTINEKDEIIKIIGRQEFMTLALSREDIPYIVSVNYGFDAQSSCLYFHCAQNGKKIDYMKSNPKIYGQILEELAYKQGECSYAYRSVQFEGVVSFVESSAEKTHALSLMIEKLENDDEIPVVKDKFITSSSIESITIGKIMVRSFTGKEERI